MAVQPPPPQPPVEEEQPAGKGKGGRAALKREMEEHKAQLERLRQQDPEFYAYLQVGGRLVWGCSLILLVAVLWELDCFRLLYSDCRPGQLVKGPTCISDA